MEMSLFYKAILYFDNDFDSDAEGIDGGYEASYGVSNNGWQNPFIHNARYAVIISNSHLEKR